MATEAQISELRRMINDATPGGEYTDDELSSLIDAASSNLNVVASGIWTEKAGRYSQLVDVQEGSSRRSLGSLGTNALKMAAYYRDAADGVGGIRASRTRAIERP